MRTFDSLWYHLPWAASFAQTGQITALRFTDVEYLTAFYPATSELIHGLGIVLVSRDTLSPALNLVWLGLVLLAGFGLIIARFRRRLDDTRVAELTRLSEIAMTDALTGVRNHRAFHEDLARSVHRVGRTGVPVSLVILDLDRFKEVNDTLGHQAGDEHLRALADAIRVCARGSDCAYRLGGDEFAVILDNTRHWGALEFVHRLQSKLAQSLTEMPLRATAGIAEAHSFTDKDRLIRQADLALIDTKRRGLGAVARLRLRASCRKNMRRFHPER